MEPTDDSPIVQQVEKPLGDVIRETILDVLRSQQDATANEALAEERRQRQTLEQRLNELIEENRQARAKAEEAERHGAIRSELERLGVAKVELAFRAVKDDVQRGEHGRLVAKTTSGEVDVTSYLKQFVEENPELLPARASGGSGLVAGSRGPADSYRVDLDKIRPGMSAEELERVRCEIVRVANQAFRGM